MTSPATPMPTSNHPTKTPLRESLPTVSRTTGELPPATGRTNSSGLPSRRTTRSQSREEARMPATATTSAFQLSTRTESSSVPISSAIREKSISNRNSARKSLWMFSQTTPGQSPTESHLQMPRRHLRLPAGLCILSGATDR